MARYDRWSQGNREATWVKPVLYDNQSKDSITLKTVDAAGDYLFFA